MDSTGRLPLLLPLLAFHNFILCPLSIGAGNTVMRSTSAEGNWILKSKRSAVKIAYLHWLAVQEERFGFLLMWYFSTKRGKNAQNRTNLL